jgi:hypothetical protein
MIHFAIFEACTLRADPIAQFWVFLVSLWHIACNAGIETGGVLVGVFKMKAKRQQPKPTHSDHVLHNSHAAS